MQTIVLVTPMAYDLPTFAKEVVYAGIDAGTNTIIKNNKRALFAIGDYDSAQIIDKTCVDNIIELDTMKNETDTQLAIQHAFKLGFDKIIVYGAFNGRVDHELANISLLVNNENIVLMNEDNYMEKIKKGKTVVSNYGYTYVSFIPLDDCTISLINFKYELDNKYIKKSDILTISNELSGNGIIETTKDILMIQSKDKKKI